MVFLEPPVGFAPTMRVVAVLMECRGRILMLLRQDAKPQGNTWCLPAGKVAEGEGELDALRREAFEETGHRLDPTQIEPVRRVFVRYADFDFVYTIFRCRLAEQPGVRLAPEEHKGFRWLTPQEALEMPLIPDEDVCLKLSYGLE